MPVSDTKKEYEAFKGKWKRARDVAAGSDEVKAAGEAYLPKLKAQTGTDYDGFKLRATYYNATYRVLAAMLGMLFRKPPTQDIPDSITPLLENVNLQGDNLITFATKLVYELLTVGRIGVLIDHTKRPQGTLITKAVAEQIGLRPTVQMYCTESVINWRTKTVNNKTVLGLVVLKEETVVVDPKDRFKETCETRYRVLEIDDYGYYSMTVYKVGSDLKEVVVEPTFYPIMDNTPMREIPFYFVGPGGIQVECEEPPMIDLIDLNLAHYRVSADYEHGCHFTGLPQAVISGYNVGTSDDGKEPEQFFIGGNKAWVFSDPQAKAQYMEFTGQGLAALEKNLDRKESQMAILGARMLAPEKKTAETATTAAIHRTGENSILSSVALAASETLTKALTLLAKWYGVDKECEYKLNREFMPFLLDAPFITAIVQSYMQGAISFEDMFDLFQRGDLIDNEKTVEEALAAIKKEKDERAKQAVDQAKALAEASGGPNPAGKQPPPKS